MLRHAKSGRTVSLVASTTVGRHPSNILHIDDEAASKRHAVIEWTGRAWVVRDLASRNGTFVNGAAITPGEDVPLPLAACVAFGDQGQRWWLDDDSAPRPFAVSLVDGRRVDAIGDVLGLPSNDAPEVMVFPGYPLWVVEDEQGTRPMEDGGVVVAGGGSWRVTVPEAIDPTAALPVPQPGLSVIVGGTLIGPRVQVEVGETVHRLRRQSSHRLLWVLTRERFADRARAAADRGLSHVVDVAKELQVEPKAIDVYVHRLRERLGRHGVHALIERRQGAGQLRLSYPSVAWRPAG